MRVGKIPKFKIVNLFVRLLIIINHQISYLLFIFLASLLITFIVNYAWLSFYIVDYIL